MITEGGCLCGSVRYAIDGTPPAAINCHCSLCRKAHGAPYGAFLVVLARNFRWLAGQDKLTSFASSAGFTRQFCANCGSQLVVLEDWNPHGITLAMGSLDSDPGIRPGGHMFVASKAPWHEITDSLPRSDGWPEGLGPHA